MKPDEIRALLAELLAGAAGGTVARWAELIGPVDSLSIVQHIHSNWRISPIATGAELAAIVSAVDIVRAEHPYAEWKPPSRPIA